jgi:hypothetical protein
MAGKAWEGSGQNNEAQVKNRRLGPPHRLQAVVESVSYLLDPSVLRSKQEK